MLNKNKRTNINSIQIAIVILGLITGSLFVYANEKAIQTNKETPIFKLASTEINEQNSCKIVYLTEEINCTENCKTQDWHIWSHKLFKSAMNSAHPKISCDVPTGSTYDFEFNIDNQRHISNISVTHRFGDDDSAQILSGKVKDNLFALKKSISELNNNPILSYPANKKRINTKILGAIQIVNNTIFVHVIQTETP